MTERPHTTRVDFTPAQMARLERAGLDLGNGNIATWLVERASPAHWCAIDHEPVRHNDSGDDERCPVCRERDRADELQRRLDVMTRRYAERT